MSLYIFMLLHSFLRLKAMSDEHKQMLEEDAAPEGGAAGSAAATPLLKSKAKSFHNLVGVNTYTINTSRETFKYDNLVMDVWGRNAEFKRKWSFILYMFSVGSLIIYSILCATTLPKFNEQGVVNTLSLLVLDSGLYLLQRGGCSWTPGYVSMILLLCRVAICAFGGDYFIMGHTFAFMVFGIGVFQEIVARRLYIITSEDAGAVAFFGKDGLTKPNYDLAGAPEMVLLYTTFVFLFTLMAYIFTTPNIATVKVILYPLNQNVSI
jgi:hypothetical protein